MRVLSQNDNVAKVVGLVEIALKKKKPSIYIQCVNPVACGHCT